MSYYHSFILHRVVSMAAWRYLQGPVPGDAQWRLAELFQFTTSSYHHCWGDFHCSPTSHTPGMECFGGYVTVCYWLSASGLAALSGPILDAKMSQGATGWDLLIASAWGLRRFVTLRLNTVIPFWNFIPLQKTTNKTKSLSLYAQISHR